MTLRLPGPPGDEFGDQQLTVPQAPPADFVTTDHGIETVTVTASRSTDWGPWLLAAALAGAVWYFVSE